MTVHKFGTDELDRAIALAEHAEIPVVVYGPDAGDLLPKLREALGDKAEYVGLVPGSNTRGALAAGLSGAFEANGYKAIYCMATDEQLDPALLDKLAAAEFVVAQASYADALTERADVVLPDTIWAEKSGSSTNTEGQVQTLQASLRAPAGAKQDTEILDLLAAKLG